MASAELWTNPSLSDCPGVRFSIQISESQGTEGTAKCNQSFQICTVYMGPYICISPCTTLLSIPEVDTSHYRPMLGFQNQKHT